MDILFFFIYFLLSKEYNEQIIITKKNSNFYKDYFFNCKVNGSLSVPWYYPEFSGGAIYSQGNSEISLNVKKCNFSSCFSKHRGGALFSYKVGQIQLEYNNFQNCFSEYGSGVYIREFQVSSEENKECISGCSFIKCHSSFYGGGILAQALPKKFKILNSLFTHCEADSWGGGLHLNTERMNDTSKIILSYLFFDNNKGSNGHDTGINAGSVQHGQFIISPFHFCFTTNIKNCLYYTSYNESMFIDNWFNEGIQNMFVKNRNGENKEGCGLFEDKACKTINICISMIKNSGGWWINVLDEIEEDDTINVENGLYVNVTGRGTAVSSLMNKNQSSPFFSVGGSIFISFLSLILNNPSIFNIKTNSNLEILYLVIKS